MILATHARNTETHISLLLCHAHLLTLPPPEVQVLLILGPLPRRYQPLTCLGARNFACAMLFLVLPQHLQHGQPFGPDWPHFR